jgi:hypothetical protein
LISDIRHSWGAQARVLAYADTAYAVALIAAVSIPLVFLMRRPRGGGKVEERRRMFRSNA